MDTTAIPSPLRPIKPPSARVSHSRYSVHKLKRLRSRQRQKAQNAKAGIKLVTDMATFRRQNHVAQQLRTPKDPGGKFVDAAALKALEGEPSSASVGNWNWLKHKASLRRPAESPSSASVATRSPLGQDLSPEDRPIVIGIALPPDLAERGNASLNAHATMLATPLNASAHPASRSQTNVESDGVRGAPVTPSQQRSAWSPDTPETTSSFQSPRPASSIYSQATGLGMGASHDAPPVPNLPSTYRQQQPLISLDSGNSDEGPVALSQARRPTSSVYSQWTAQNVLVLHDAPPVPAVPVEHQRRQGPEADELQSGDEDDGGSPCTLFEEDGPALGARRGEREQDVSKSPGSAESQTRGWWDHVITPFTERTSPLREALQKSQQHLFSKSHSPDVHTSKRDLASSNVTKVDKPLAATVRSGLPASPRPSPKDISTPIVKVPTPRRTPSPFLGPRAGSPASSSRSVTPHIDHPSTKTMSALQGHQIPSDEPPPYSPPKDQTTVKYRAVFPTGHPLNNLYPPSPGPNSPAMAGTMSSQGGISMTDISLTPDGCNYALPRRQPGTFVPQEHTLTASAPEHRVERERRRHEKEEVVARKLGGFWRGRGCVPVSGCFGRPGREGRKRRRICFGLCSGVVACLILLIVLCVTLIPRGGGSAEVNSIFVNLTDFPPMPTGLLSINGPDNSVAVHGCTSPSTIWSCALPKDNHDEVAPFRPNQPSFFLHIQWDNGTKESWHIPNEDPPRPGGDSSNRDRARSFGAKSGGIIARARAALVRRQDRGDFSPDPEPPSFEEMYFLGNTTDGVVSAEKAGEPTPFYLSIRKSADDLVSANSLDKRLRERQDENLRDGQNSSEFPVELPDPDLNDDGTGAPARFMPEAYQQPVRLYDRDLDTEHYGFYTYFTRSIYLKSVTAINGSRPEGEEDTTVPLDEEGGSTRNEANFIVSWSQTRFLVQIWTRAENTTRLVPDRGRFGVRSDDESTTTDRPGTMPYPVTVTVDSHGGKSGEKVTWHWRVDERQRIDTSDPKLILNDVGFGGEVVNPRARNDTSFGGFDGGDGGCKCEWINFLNRRDVSGED